MRMSSVMKKKKLMFFIFFVSVLFVSCLSDSTKKSSDLLVNKTVTVLEPELINNVVPEDSDEYKYLQYDDGYFKIHWIPYEYKLLNEEFHYYSNNIQISYISFNRENQSRIKKEGSYFLINDNMLKIEFDCDNEYAKLGDSNLFLFKKDGVSSVKISIGNELTTEVNISQITLPLSMYDDFDKLIELFGFEDYKKSYIVEWPDYKTIDGIFYDTRTNVKDIYVTHYFYKKYPYLCISYNIAGLFKCGTTANWKKVLD